MLLTAKIVYWEILILFKNIFWYSEEIFINEYIKWRFMKIRKWTKRFLENAVFYRSNFKLKWADLIRFTLSMKLYAE